MQFFRKKIVLEREYLHKKRSVQEIADELGVSCHKIIYWMDKHGIRRRSWSEATYIKRNPNGNPFKIKEKLTEEEKALFFLAIGLYLGEGAKYKKATGVALANTDPLIIRVFLKFLIEICGIDLNKIKLELNIYDDTDVKRALEYWSLITELPLSHFSKPFVRKARKGNYRRWSRYGTLTIRVSNAKLLEKVLGWCHQYVSSFGGVVTYLHLFLKGRGSSVEERLHGKQKVGGSIPLLGSIVSH